MNETKTRFEALINDLVDGEWVYTKHQIYPDGRMVVYLKVKKPVKQSERIILYKSSENI